MEHNIWCSFSESYDHVIPQMHCYQRMLDKIIRYAESAQQIIDAGCGTGIVSENLVRLGKSVVGFDNNQKMLDLAIQKSHRYIRETSKNDWHIYPGDVTSFPTEVPHDADMVIFNNVLFYVKDFTTVFKQAYSHLKAGGIVIVTGPCKRPDAEKVYKAIQNEWIDNKLYSPELKSAFEHHMDLSRRLTSQEMCTFFAPEELVKILKSVGFKTVLEASNEDYYGENFFVAMVK